jgi:modulator of FtsH protease HflC
MQFPNEQGRSGRRGMAALITVVVAGFIASNAFFSVQEWEQVLILQFGDIVGDPVTRAGLHVKIPFIHKVERFEKRLLRWDGQETSTITRDRKTVVVDITARWRIADARRFREAVREQRYAGSRLNGIIEGAVKDEIAKYDLYEVVRSSNLILRDFEDQRAAGSTNGTALPPVAELVSALSGGETPALQKDESGRLLAGRPAVLAGILAEARKRLEQVDLGIQLEDLLIKQLNYSAEIEANVYAQMNAELQKISAGFRSAGRQRAEERLGEMEKEIATILSRAQEQSERVRGEAEAVSIGIYAEAFNQDPEFYTFLRTLQAYSQTIRDNTTLILGADSPLYQGLVVPLATTLDR